MTYATRAVGAFLDDVASAAVVPSGGAVAAVCGAAGAALCEMVCLHTVGKEGYADVEADIVDAGEGLRSCREELLELADADATAVERMQAAYGSSDGRTRLDVEDALKGATTVPLDTAGVCLEVLEHGAMVTEAGTDRTTADGMAGVLLAHAALRASVTTVRVNLELVDDEAFVTGTDERVAELERRADAILDGLSTP